MAEIQKHYLNINGDHFVAVFKDQAAANAYVPPVGATSVPARPSPYHEWNGGEWVEGDVPPPSVDAVHAERERRIALPLEVTLSVGAIEINMDAPSQRNIQGLASVGQYLAVANPSQMTDFRAYDNNTYSLTPADLVGMGLQVAGRIQACYAAEWALKALSPIPSAYTDDQYWP